MLVKEANQVRSERLRQRTAIANYDGGSPDLRYALRWHSRTQVSWGNEMYVLVPSTNALGWVVNESYVF